MPAGIGLTRDWRRLRSVLRAVFGLACLYSQILDPRGGSRAVSVAAGAYVAYALIALLWQKFNEIQCSLPSLFAETAFFVAFAVYGSDRLGWLGSALFLYLITFAVLHHAFGDVCIVTGACLAFFVVVQAPEAKGVRQVVAAAGGMGCVLAYEKRKLIGRLVDSGPLQSFISMQVRLDILGTLLKRDPASGMADLRELQQLARSQVSEVRSFLRSMKPVEVDGSDLVTSIRRITEYFQKDTGISARFTSTASEVRIAPETGQELLQVIRESLHNVQKHSKATRVVVALEHPGKTVEISVDDDGAGFPFSGSFTLDELDLLRLGPQSIKRRVRSLGGDLEIESRPGHGAGLKFKIPV
jgi:signal transduction histidine kinase